MNYTFERIVHTIKDSLAMRFIIIVQILMVVYLTICCFGRPVSIELDENTTMGETKWSELNKDKNHVIIASGIALNGGSYNLLADFDIDRLEENREAYRESPSMIYVSSKDYPLGVKAENQLFPYGESRLCSRVNIDSWCNVKELSVQLEVPYNYTLNKLEIEECVYYRYIRLLLALLIFVFGDYAFLYVRRLYIEGNKAKFAFCLGMCITLLMSMLPNFKYNSPTGDDYIFHLSRIYEISQELLQGNFPVRMYQGANNGFSYASPLFYCDTFLYIPAFLYLVRIPLRLCYNIYVLFVGILTLFTTDLLFKKIFGSKEYAYRMLGTTLYMLSYYRISNVFTRSAVGEYTAMAFLPLLVIGIYGVCKHSHITGSDIFYTVIGTSGIIQCHLISVEIVGAVAGAYALYHYKNWLNKSNICKVLITGTLIVGLNIWFIYPMMDSWSMNLAVFVRDESAIQKYGLYMNNLLSVINKADGSAHGMGGALLVGVFLGVLVYFYAKNILPTSVRSILVDSLVITLVCMILTTVYFPWDTISKWGRLMKIFTKIQFPWRYLSIVTLTGSIVCTLAVYSIVKFFKDTTREYISGLIIAILVVFNLLGLGYYYNDISNYSKLSSKNYVYDLNSGIRVEEYMLFPKADDIPYDTLVDIVGTDMKDYSLYYENDVSASILNQRKHIYYIKNESDNIDYIILPVMDYDNYHVIDMADGRELRIISKEINNQYIVAEIPANYDGTVNVKYIPPLSWHVAEIVSLLTFFSLGISVVMNRRKVTNNA